MLIFLNAAQCQSYLLSSRALVFGILDSESFWSKHTSNLTTLQTKLSWVYLQPNPSIIPTKSKFILTSCQMTRYYTLIFSSFKIRSLKDLEYLAMQVSTEGKSWRLKTINPRLILGANNFCIQGASNWMDYSSNYHS